MRNKQIRNTKTGIPFLSNCIKIQFKNFHLKPQVHARVPPKKASWLETGDRSQCHSFLAHFPNVLLRGVRQMQRTHVPFEDFVRTGAHGNTICDLKTSLWRNTVHSGLMLYNRLPRFYKRVYRDSCMVNSKIHFYVCTLQTDYWLVVPDFETFPKKKKNT